MANENAVTKLPRYIKRFISMGEAQGNYDKGEARKMRKMFLDAHVHYVSNKMKRTDNRDKSSGE